MSEQRTRLIYNRGRLYTFPWRDDMWVRRGERWIDYGPGWYTHDAAGQLVQFVPALKDRYGIGLVVPAGRLVPFRPDPEWIALDVEQVVRDSTVGLFHWTESDAGPVVDEVTAELDYAYAKHGDFQSSHEGYAVILEELDEAWEEIKRNDKGRAREEMIQVAAMAIKFLLWCDKEEATG